MDKVDAVDLYRTIQAELPALITFVYFYRYSYRFENFDDFDGELLIVLDPDSDTFHVRLESGAVYIWTSAEQWVQHVKPYREKIRKRIETNKKFAEKMKGFTL